MRDRHVETMSRVTLALIAVTASADAATFEERLERANAAFDSEQGGAYQKQLGPNIQRAIRQCAPGGPAGKGLSGKLVLVADVSADGKIRNPMVRPETRASTCIVEALSAQSLPAPPDRLLLDGVAPLSVEIFIVP